jgi:hypothetical protein
MSRPTDSDVPGPSASNFNRADLLNPNTGDRPADHELLDLLGDFEDVEDPLDESSQ